MQIAKNMVVVFDYTLTNHSGQEIENSKESGPFAYIHGSNNIIPGLEKALEGKRVGEKFKIPVAPKDGYGERDDTLVAIVGADRFESEQVQIGMRFHTETNHGMRMFTVTKIDGDQVTVDGNHPLAGEPLTFDVNILEVRVATAEELSHGHVHGPDDDHHH